MHGPVAPPPTGRPPRPPRPVVAACPDFRKEFRTREDAERWIARVEEIGACSHVHTVEEVEGD